MLSFRQKILLKLVEFCGVFVLKILFSFAKIKVTNQKTLPEQFLLCCWHSEFLFPVWFFRGGKMTAIVSKSFDGELVSKVLLKLGYKLARGSSHKGSFFAYRESLKILKEGLPLAITPDGPKGAEKIVKNGICELALKTSLPILPVRVFSEKGFRLKTWDKFLIPFGETELVFGDLVFPKGKKVESLVSEVQKAMESLG
ncbi:DUF374 domain-containing protein [bacterium]|nr:DUF374 domain-containing protein [bacterium]